MVKMVKNTCCPVHPLHKMKISLILKGDILKGDNVSRIRDKDTRKECGGRAERTVRVV
jgi:hypothetical protein